MAKRFTDTNKYKKTFFRALPGPYKLFWDFLYHDCDHAGIWIVDFEIAQLYVGKDMTICKSDALKFFNDNEVRIIEFDNGKKWFIPSFICFQYGKLSENNRAHTSAISILKKNFLINDGLNVKMPTSPLQGDKEMVKEQVMDKEMEEEEEKEEEEKKKNEKFIVPEMQKIWKKEKPEYPDDVNKDFTALREISIFICNQSGIKSPVKNKNDTESILKLWKIISSFVSGHNFFKNYSLYQIEKHIQSITQEIKNGESGNKNGKTGAGKVNGQQLNTAFAKFYSN